MTRQDFRGNRYTGLDTASEAVSRKITVKQAASDAGTGLSTVDKAKAILENDPETFKAIEDGHISTTTAQRMAKLEPEQKKKIIESIKHGKKRPRAAKKSEPHPATIADNAQINEPSLFPVDAPLPVHKSGELNTKYIREAITELRKNEPLLGKMSRATMNEDIWTYTQRIQTYGMNLEKDGRVCGPIDQRFILWAGTVANKVRAREAILDRISRAVERGQAKVNGSAPAPRAPQKGPAGRLYKLQHELKKLRTALRKIHFSQGDLPELKRIFDRFISDYFEDINPSSNNGSKDPLQQKTA